MTIKIFHHPVEAYPWYAEVHFPPRHIARGYFATRERADEWAADEKAKAAANLLTPAQPTTTTITRSGFHDLPWFAKVSSDTTSTTSSYFPSRDHANAWAAVEADRHDSLAMPS